MALIYLANLEGKSTPSDVAGKFKTIHFPMGLGIISGVLQTTEHKVRVVDNYVSGITTQDILAEFASAKPDYICLSGFLGNYQYPYIKRASGQIKTACPESILIIGGPMATTIPELLLDYSEINFVVLGEGEETILDLLDALERDRPVSDVPGIAFRDEDGCVRRTAPRLRMKDLSKYPLPDYELFDMASYVEYLKEFDRCWEISTSRGCYARCSYCKLTFGNKITFRQVDHVVAEMSLIKKQFRIDRFNFVDDNFLNSPRQVDEMADGLRQCSDNFQFRFQGRADRINKNLAKTLKDVGCFDISYGLESGSQKIIDDMGKSLDVKKAEENLKSVVDDSGLNVHATFIIGMPLENDETIAETKNYIRRIGLPNFSAGILTPFPDTQIYKHAKDQGLIEDDNIYCDNLGTVYDDVYVNLTQFDNERIRDWRNEINGSKVDHYEF